MLFDQWDHDKTQFTPALAEKEWRKRIEGCLDSGYGNAWLKSPALAGIVQAAMLFFDGTRYRLHAWVVMPNHVHAVLTPKTAFDLGSILHSWKSYTASKCNELLGRDGSFWQKEYFDRFIRDQLHFERAVAYVEFNPVKAGRCETPEDWQWGSAHWRCHSGTH